MLDRDDMRTCRYFQIEIERLERAKLEYAVKTGCLPDDAKMDINIASLKASVLPLPPLLAATSESSESSLRRHRAETRSHRSADTQYSDHRICFGHLIST